MRFCIVQWYDLEGKHVSMEVCLLEWTGTFSFNNEKSLIDHKRQQSSVKFKESEENSEIHVHWHMLLELVTLQPSDFDWVSTLSRCIYFIVNTFDPEEDFSQCMCLDCPKLENLISTV